MLWRGRRESSNVEDARGESTGRAGGSLGLLMLVYRFFGLKGLLIALVVGGVLWKVGLFDAGNHQLSNGPATGGASAPGGSAEQQDRFHFVKVVLADTEDVWTAEFARHNRQYEDPVLKLYTDRVATGCGEGTAQAGPFYCPEDRKVYIDLSFYDELAQTFNSPGDFAQAYVLAHEIGHHVQKLLGISDKVSAMRGRPDYNEYSVRLELQADYFAGVWANHSKQYLERGDIEEAMRAANAIGDDAIQMKMRGRVVPHSFTHGTSAQRMRWFNKGLESGRIEDGDTFSVPYSSL
jgi:predicted metalloprotease